MKERLRGRRSGLLWAVILLGATSIWGGRHYWVVWRPAQIVYEGLSRCEDYRGAGLWEEGLTACATAVAIAPDNPTAVVLRQAVEDGWLDHYYRQGEAALAAGESAKALDALQKVFDLDATYRQVGALRQQAIAAHTPSPAPSATPDATQTQAALAATSTAPALPSPVVTHSETPTTTSTATPVPTATAAPTPLPDFQTLILDYRRAERAALQTLDPNVLAQLPVFTHGEALAAIQNHVATLRTEGQYQILIVEEVEIIQVTADTVAGVLTSEQHNLQTFARATGSDQLLAQEVNRVSVVYGFVEHEGRWKVEKVRVVATGP